MVGFRADKFRNEPSVQEHTFSSSAISQDVGPFLIPYFDLHTYVIFLAIHSHEGNAGHFHIISKFIVCYLMMERVYL